VLLDTALLIDLLHGDDGAVKKAREFESKGSVEIFNA
jgi:hypothetical protein